MLIVYSSERRLNSASNIGRIHYSYTFIEDAFVGLLDRGGFRTKLVQAPESVNNDRAAQALFGQSPAEIVHIGFRSTENFRPIRGARNIIHFAWEFDFLRNSHAMDDPVTQDQIAMLRLADEIWVGCEYTRQVLKRYGLGNCHVVPAPIALPPPRTPQRRSESWQKLSDIPIVPLRFASGLPRAARRLLAAESQIPLAAHPLLRRCNERDGIVFGSVLNPADLRKNLLNLIEGFAAANAEVDNRDVLLLKLAVPNNGDFRAGAVFDELISCGGGNLAYFEDCILVTTDYLNNEEMGCLFSMLDYYVCASHCEGFNLPLLEAMAHGAVPVSCINTAMKDYLDAETAIEIASRRYPAIVGGMAGEIARMPFDIEVADYSDVKQAVLCAQAQSLPQRASMSMQAQARVAERYGEEVSLQRVSARLGRSSAGRDHV